MLEHYCSVTDFACATIFFCTLRHIVRQRAYVICDAIIYSKRPLLRLRHLSSNNELSAVKAHSVYTADTDKTRQASFVLSVSAVWTRHNNVTKYCCVFTVYRYFLIRRISRARRDWGKAEERIFDWFESESAALRQRISGVRIGLWA